MNYKNVKILQNEKHRSKIRIIYNRRYEFTPMERSTIEDIKYRLDIGNPLLPYEIAWINSFYRQVNGRLL